MNRINETGMHYVGLPGSSVRNSHIVAFHFSACTTESMREKRKEIRSSPIKIKNITQPAILNYDVFSDYTESNNLCFCKATILLV